jgi:hypothetical protein
MRGCERGDHRVKSRCPNIREGAGDVRGNPQPKRRAEIVRVAVVKSNFVKAHFAMMVDDFQCSWSRLERFLFGYLPEIHTAHYSWA